MFRSWQTHDTPSSTELAQAQWGLMSPRAPSADKWVLRRGSTHAERLTHAGDSQLTAAVALRNLKNDLRAPEIWGQRPDGQSTARWCRERVFGGAGQWSAQDESQATRGNPYGVSTQRLYPRSAAAQASSNRASDATVRSAKHERGAGACLFGRAGREAWRISAGVASGEAARAPVAATPPSTSGVIAPEHACRCRCRPACRLSPSSPTRRRPLRTASPPRPAPPPLPPLPPQEGRRHRATEHAAAPCARPPACRAVAAAFERPSYSHFKT